MQSVAAGMHGAIDHHHVAGADAANFLVGNRRFDDDFFSCELEALSDRHLFDFVLLAVQPAFDFARLGIDDHSQTTEGPALVRNRDEERCGQTIHHPDLAA